MIVNKYKKKCQSCNTTVPVGDGFAYKNGYKWLTVCNSSACIKRLGLQPPDKKGKSIERKLTEDGKILMPFDRKALPIIKSFPGARFNPDANPKHWTCSIKTGDLPRVIELAEKLQLEIPEKFKKLAEQGTEESRKAEEQANNKGLYHFQKEGVKFLALKDRVILADQMGLGKTIQALVSLPENPRVICICPNSLKYNWRTEASKWRPELNVTILSGKESWKFPEPGEMVIINPDILPERFISNKQKSADISEEEIKLLSECHLIADEAHMYKNYKAQRTQKIRTLTKHASKVIYLTGTPLENRPFDLYGVLSSGNIRLWSFSGFLKDFNGFKNKWGGYEFGTPSDLVPEKLRAVMLRRLKSEVLKDLPEKQYQDINVDLNKEEVKEIDNICSELLTQEELESQEDLLFVKNLPGFEKFSKMRKLLAKSRIPAMFEVVEEYEDAEEPLIVFSAHRDPILTLGKREGWAAITGTTSIQERDKIVNAFQNGELKGIALTIKAGGFGLTLTRASHELFVDLDWTPSANIQAEDRAHRIGQKNNLLVKRMVSNHPLDVHIQKLIARKVELCRKALDNEVEFKPIKVHNSETPKVREETEEELEERIERAGKDAEREVAKEKIYSILSREQAKSQVPEPELTPIRKQLIKKALEYMCGQCDGAKTVDGKGFNKPDAAIGHWLFKSGLDDDTVFRVAERILSRYHRQLSGQFDGIWEPNEENTFALNSLLD